MIWAGPSERIEGTDVLDVFGPIFAPANAAVDETVTALRQIYASGRPVPPEYDIAATEWIEAMDVPRATRDILLSWLAVVGGGDPAEQSILIMTSDLAMTGFGIADTLQELGETFADGSIALVEALSGQILGPIHTGAAVVKVDHDDGGVSVTTADGSVWMSSAAVIALPLNCLVDVAFDPPLDEIKVRASTQRHPGRSTKVLAVAEGFGARTLASGWGHPLQGAIGMLDVDGGSLVAAFDGLHSLRDPRDPQEGAIGAARLRSRGARRRGRLARLDRRCLLEGNLALVATRLGQRRRPVSGCARGSPVVRRRRHLLRRRRLHGGRDHVRESGCG